MSAGGFCEKVTDGRGVSAAWRLVGGWEWASKCGKGRVEGDGGRGGEAWVVVLSCRKSSVAVAPNSIST